MESDLPDQVLQTIIVAVGSLQEQVAEIVLMDKRVPLSQIIMTLAGEVTQITSLHGAQVIMVAGAAVTIKGIALRAGDGIMIRAEQELHLIHLGLAPEVPLVLQAAEVLLAARAVAVQGAEINSNNFRS